MGFTIQDMMTTMGSHYRMTLAGGEKGWSNSISWAQLVEDTVILKNFIGKELAVTMGLGFPTEDRLMELAEKLVEKHAAGLVINVGKYVEEIPESLVEYCSSNDLPLFRIPWEINIAEFVKDLSIRIFMQDTADEQIIAAIIGAIERPDNKEACRSVLLPYYHTEGRFQMVTFATLGLKDADSVERKKLSHALQIYLENITHNGIFFYYDGHFVLMLNEISDAETEEILEGMMRRTRAKSPELSLHIGVGSCVYGVENLFISYNRAKAALEYAVRCNTMREDFDRMGIDRLLYSVVDKKLLKEIGHDRLLPILQLEKGKSEEYLDTLQIYLEENGSIQKVAARLMTHRNTVLYRMNHIRKLLDCSLDESEERLSYQLALRIYRARIGGEENEKHDIF